MRPAIIIWSLLLSLPFVNLFACDCNSVGSFQKASVQADFIAFVKINKHLTFKDIYGSPIPMSMEVEILEVFKGKEDQTTIKVWGDDGHLCRPYLNIFAVDSLFVIAFHKGENGSSGHPEETEKDYSISNCGEFWLRAFSSSNELMGTQSKMNINQLRTTFDRTADLTPSDFRALFQKALDFPDLQAYLSSDTLTKQKQLVIRHFGEANHNHLKKVTKFGRPVLIKTEEEINEEGIKDYLTMSDWVCLSNKVRMQLHYPTKRVTLSLIFKKINNEWQITSHALWAE